MLNSLHSGSGLSKALLWLVTFLLVGSGKTWGEGVTFAGHIAPIIYENCVVCHRPDGVGPFSFLSYEQVKRRGQQIAEVTKSRFMPPWKPDSAYSPPLLGDRRLTESQIQLIQDWVDQGRLPGELSKAPEPPVFSDSWTLGTPDLVLEFPKAYTLPAEGLDIYRNFVIPIPIQEKKYVRVVEFLPRSQLVIHHAVMQLDESPWSRQKDASEPEPGFDGMQASKAVNPTGQFVGWTPGRITYEAHEGTAWELKPGTDLVVQLHMLPSGKPERVNPRIGLYFTDEPPTQTTDYLLLRANQIDIPAGASDYRVQETLTLPVNVSVLGISPHAHYLATDLKVYAELPDGTRRWLLRIPEWDFNWQSDYRYEEPLPIPAGSRLVMDYCYDNSVGNFRNPFNPPRRIQLGYNSTDEMAEVIVELLLENGADKPVLRRAQLDYEITQQGGLAEYSFNVGVEMEELGRIQDAVTAYERALAEKPNHAMALNNLGAIKEQFGARDQAEIHYRAAIAADHSLVEGHLNLARLLHAQGKQREAIQLLEQFLNLHPNTLDVRFQLSGFLVETGLAEKARKLLAEASATYPNEPYLNLQLGKLHAMEGSLARASQYLTTALNSEETDRQSSVSLNEIKAEASYVLAFLAQQSGDWSSLEQHLQSVFKMQPDHTDALILSTAFEVARGQEKVAVQRLDSLFSMAPEDQPDPNALLGIIPYPDGTILIAKTYSKFGQKDVAQLIIQQGLAEAQRQRNQDWINQFKRLLNEL